MGAHFIGEKDRSDCLVSATVIDDRQDDIQLLSGSALGANIDNTMKVFSI